jgi:hypothetical protein
MAHRPGSHRHATLHQSLLDVWDTVVMRRAPLADEGDAIKAKLVLGQGQSPFELGPVGLLKLGTGAVETTPNLEDETHDGFKSRDGAVVVVGSPPGVTAARTVAQYRLEGLCSGWGRSGCGTCHRYHLHL